MSLRGAVFFLCAFAIAAPVLASQGYRAVNRLLVVPINADTFEVIDTRGVSAPDIWCAGADYARRAGLDGANKRMYIDVPRGPSRTVANEMAVTFTTNPGPDIANASSPFSVSVKKRGDNYSIGHAYNFCRTLFEDAFDRF